MRKELIMSYEREEMKYEFEIKEKRGVLLGPVIKISSSSVEQRTKKKKILNRIAAAIVVVVVVDVDCVNV